MWERHSLYGYFNGGWSVDATLPLTRRYWAFWVIGLFSLAFLLTAWVSEDAFINFRTIDNYLSGLGLTWNPGERVQTYTSPLWLALLTLLVSSGLAPYSASLALSYIALLASLGLLLNLVPRWSIASAIALCALLWSRAFIDYLSSGLESPLCYVIVLLCMTRVLYAAAKPTQQTLHLTLLLSALFLTRPDSGIILLPSFIAHLRASTSPWPSSARSISLGSLPAILWLAFSLFYYGSPWPNTALAKVATGHTILQSIQQAWSYLSWTGVYDPVSLLLIALALSLVLVNPPPLIRSFIVGLLAWLVYLLYIGADYMGGRFLSTAVLVADSLLIVTFGQRAPARLVLILVTGLLLTLNSLKLTLFSSPRYQNYTIDAGGISDERGYYYRFLGLAPVIYNHTWWKHPWLLEGRALRNQSAVYTRCTIGMAAYAAGPTVYWLDPLALGNAFLARLPARDGARVGHYERALPPGYIDSLLTGENRLVDTRLRALYDDVKWATHAPLLNPQRWGAIWRLNSGYHNEAAAQFDRNAIGLPGVPAQSNMLFSCYGLPYDGSSGMWKLEGPPARAIKWQASDSTH